MLLQFVAFSFPVHLSTDVAVASLPTFLTFGRQTTNHLGKVTSFFQRVVGTVVLGASNPLTVGGARCELPTINYVSTTAVLQSFFSCSSVAD